MFLTKYFLAGNSFPLAMKPKYNFFLKLTKSITDTQHIHAGFLFQVSLQASPIYSWFDFVRQETKTKNKEVPLTDASEYDRLMALERRKGIQLLIFIHSPPLLHTFEMRPGAILIKILPSYVIKGREGVNAKFKNQLPG